MTEKRKFIRRLQPETCRSEDNACFIQAFNKSAIYFSLIVIGSFFCFTAAAELEKGDLTSCRGRIASLPVESPLFVDCGFLSGFVSRETVIERAQLEGPEGEQLQPLATAAASLMKKQTVGQLVGHINRLYISSPPDGGNQPIAHRPKAVNIVFSSPPSLYMDQELRYPKDPAWQGGGSYRRCYNEISVFSNLPAWLLLESNFIFMAPSNIGQKPAIEVWQEKEHYRCHLDLEPTSANEKTVVYQFVLHVANEKPIAIKLGFDKRAETYDLNMHPYRVSHATLPHIHCQYRDQDFPANVASQWNKTLKQVLNDKSLDQGSQENRELRGSLSEHCRILDSHQTSSAPSAASRPSSLDER